MSCASVTRHNKLWPWWNVLISWQWSTVRSAWDVPVINRRETRYVTEVRLCAVITLQSLRWERRGRSRSWNKEDYYLPSRWQLFVCCLSSASVMSSPFIDGLTRTRSYSNNVHFSSSEAQYLCLLCKCGRVTVDVWTFSYTRTWSGACNNVFAISQALCIASIKRQQNTSSTDVACIPGGASALAKCLSVWVENSLALQLQRYTVAGEQSVVERDH